MRRKQQFGEVGIPLWMKSKIWSMQHIAAINNTTGFRPRHTWLDATCSVDIDFGEEYLLRLEVYDKSGLACIFRIYPLHAPNR
jgi:hypothetical protein